MIKDLLYIFEYILIKYANLAHFYRNSTINYQPLQFIIMHQHEKKSILMSVHQYELTKKLQVLQNENRTLQQSKDSFQTNIRRLVDNVNELDRHLQQKQEQNQELRQKNKEISAISRKLQLQNERLNQEYSALYNFAGMQKKRGSRELISKEMQLNNRLHQIQNNGYQKVIDQLKDNLEKKKGQIVALISENSKIKKDLLATTYQFHEQIYSLKEEIAALKAQALAFIQDQKPLKEHSFLCGAQNSLSTLKIQKMQSELNLCERQLVSVSNELVQYKSQLYHYKHEAQWLQAKLQKRDPVNKAQVDFNKAKQLLQENSALRKQIQQEKMKMIALLQDNPELMSQLKQFDLSNPLQELQQNITELKNQIELKDRDLGILRNNLQKTQQQTAHIDELLFKTKAKSLKVIEKLTTIIKKYVPYINLYGLSDYGFDDEECKLIDQNSSGIQKEFDRVCSELSTRKAQAKKLENKLKQAEQKIKYKEQRIELLTKNDKQQHEQNEKLLKSLQMLAKRANSLQMTIQRYEMNEGSQQSYNADFNEQEGRERYQASHTQLQQRSLQVQNLRQLVCELQQDRERCLSLIRSKDLMIAEANGQLSILKSQSTPKSYNFGTIASFPAVDYYKNNRKGGQIYQNTNFLSQNTLKYQQFKKTLNTLSQDYENEVRILTEQHNKKYSNLDIKYQKLLSQYSKFQEQYKKLQQAYEDSIKKNQSQGKKIEVGQSQNYNNEHIDGTINARDDNNSINETTIQTINQLLKKYQKEFNRFSQLYQSEMVKANELKNQSYTFMEHQSTEQNFKSQIERVQIILIQNQQTISMLQKELREKDEQLLSERQHYETNELVSDQRLAQLQMRCNELNAQIQSQQRKIFQSHGQKQEANIQESAVLISVLTSKNNEISSLKEKIEQKQRIIQQNRRDISNLLDKQVDEQSILQLEEFKAFRNYLEQNDLLNLLEVVCQRIDNTAPRSQ